MIEKADEEFNVEHVLPQAFGTFEQNFTLVHVVCSACNRMFSRELEPWLSRDSLEGFDRYRHGQKSPSEFKSQGRRSMTRVQLMEGPYAGAWGYSIPGEAGLGTRPFPQVGFARSADGPFSWFMLDGLPTTNHLKTLGFAGDIHVRLCECDQSEATRRLSDVGMACGLIDSFPPPSGPAQIEQVFRVELPHRRALAKIALNYVARQFGGHVALDASFHPIRAFDPAPTRWTVSLRCLS